MSNNVWLAYEKGGVWFGWDEAAEAIDIDRNGIRKVSLDDAITANSFDDLMEELGSDGDKPEYGIMMLTNQGKSNSSRLPLDGTHIKIVDES